MATKCQPKSQVLQTEKNEPQSGSTNECNANVPHTNDLLGTLALGVLATC